MSYSYDLADKALIQFRELEPWIAEEILDEMELLIRKAPFEGRRYAGGFIHDFVRPHGSDTVYVFLMIVPDSKLELLQIVNIGLHLRRAPDPEES